MSELQVAAALGAPGFNESQQRLHVVTTDTHAPRASGVFGHVLGEEYTAKTHIAIAGKFGGDSGRRIAEARGNLLARAVFRGTRPGEDEKIFERL